MPDALSVAVEKSSRLMAEDLCREAGFMLPQSGNTKAFLESIKAYPGIPADVVESLLHTIQFNEKTEETKMEKWNCLIREFGMYNQNWCGCEFSRRDISTDGR